MTRLLEQAIEAARELSPHEQDEIAQAIFAIASNKDKGVYVLSEEEEAAIDLGLAAAERGEFASEEEVTALFAKYRL